MNERVIVGRAYGVTELDPLTMFVMGILIIVSFASVRRYTLTGLLVAIAILPSAQRLVIGGFDFPMVRLLMTLSWILVLTGRTSGQFRMRRMNRIDIALIVWALSASVIYIARLGNAGAIAYRAGILLDVFGVFFLVRYRVWNRDQLMGLLRVCGLIAIVVGIAMAVEFSTGRNYFSVFGSANELTMERDGEFRAVSSFSHPIMAGTFGAAILPMMIGIWIMEPRMRWLAILGGIGSVSIVLSSNSSGPLIASAFSVGCWGMWRYRTYLTQLRWAVVILALVIHFGRSQPIWHLILRMGEVLGSGTGYHRFYLIDATVNHWKDWLLLGTSGAAGWGWGLQDLTNQWVYEAVNGGLLSLVAFNALLFLAFIELGLAFKAIEEAKGLRASERRQFLFMGWTQGVILSTFCASFLSVSLFGQLNSFFYLLLAVISSYVDACHRTARRLAQRPTRAPSNGRPSMVPNRQKAEWEGAAANPPSRPVPGRTGTLGDLLRG